MLTLTEARLARLLRVLCCTMVMFLTPFVVSSGGEEEAGPVTPPESTCQWDSLVPERFPNETDPSPIPDTWSADSDIRWLSDADQIENDRPIYGVRRMIWNVGYQNRNVTWQAGRMQVTPIYANEYATVYEDGVLHVNKIRGKLYPWSNQIGIDTDAYLSYRMTHDQSIQRVRSTVCIVLGQASPEQPDDWTDRYRSEIIIDVSTNGTGIYSLTYLVLNYTDIHVKVTVSPGVRISPEVRTIIYPTLDDLLECQCGTSIELSSMEYWEESLEVNDLLPTTDDVPAADDILPITIYFGITLDWGDRSVTAIVHNYGL